MAGMTNVRSFFIKIFSISPYIAKSLHKLMNGKRAKMLQGDFLDLRKLLAHTTRKTDYTKHVELPLRDVWSISAAPISLLLSSQGWTKLPIARSLSLFPP